MSNAKAAAAPDREHSTISQRLRARGSTPQQRILWAAMFVPGVNGRRGLPYCLVGKPGSAKTSVVGQLATAAGLHYEPVLASLRSPVDFLGVPVPQRRKLTAFDQHLDPDGGDELLFMHYAPAGFAVRAAAARRSVLFLDEANTCPPSVQAALLRVLFEGVVGELQMPPGVRIMLAMNHEEHAAGGFSIAPPLANRLGWLDWDEPSVAGFTQYLSTRGVPVSVNQAADGTWEQAGAQVGSPEHEEAAVDALWPKAWAQASGEIAGFLQRKPNLLLQMPKDATREWPSPRTWEMAIRALAGSYVYDLTDLEATTAVAAFVGQGPFAEFHTWRREADLPDPEKLLDGAAQFKHSPSRLDRTAAVLTACASLVTPSEAPKRKERADALWKLIGTMTDDAVDICLPAVSGMCKANLMIGCNEAYKILAKMEPVMNAAGLTRSL